MDTQIIDRIAPTRRPNEAVVGYQRWGSLLFLHWAVPTEVLRPLVPATLSLDLYDGVAYVGVVPFAMEGIRPSWCPEMCAFNFLETNVRTYVLCDGQPGVYFFSGVWRISLPADRQFAATPYFIRAYALQCSFEYATRKLLSYKKL